MSKIKNDVLWVNKRAPKGVMNNKTFNTGLVYEAHTVEDRGLEEYINKQGYDLVMGYIKGLKGHEDIKKYLGME